MPLRQRLVTVKQLPETLDGNSERLFLRELEMAFSQEKPAIVIDCSQVRHMDNTAIHLLLSCLEEALKRNGDVRLAGVSSEAYESFAHTRVDQLFRIFDNIETAAESFQRRTASILSPVAAVPSEHAA
jgi:anti-anti-sigma factor